ncbi:MAG: hypothetical protein IBX62_06315 [Coriobacteriia bacterium]|nr:hypothetical protein [Coriobacteriia bacterium]
MDSTADGSRDLGAARSALATSRQALLRRPNVVATGVGYKQVEGESTGEVGIVCSVTRKLPATQLAPGDLVPSEVEGVRTDVVQTGVIRALDWEPAAQPDEPGDPKRRHRPAPGGVSVGHVAVTAGTLGCLVRRGGEILILSNNHVLAVSNAASPGDTILQPGPYDGGSDPGDAIALLDAFVPIRLAEGPSSCPLAAGAARALNALARLFGSDTRLRAVSLAAPENLVDAALGAPLDPSLVSPEILGVGTPQGAASGELGMRVRKSGRTTGLTEGRIEQVDVTVDVTYGERTARFADQLMAGAMSAGGDSGSVVLDGTGAAVGLLFAGSETSTIVNRIENVLTALGVAL